MTRHYDDWLRAYIDYSSMSEAPDKFHFWTGVSVIAGALRRRVALSHIMGYFEWVPNFYIVFVAPPGIVSKSTTANIGMDLLKQVPDVFFGPQVVTWQALVKTFAECRSNIHRSNGTIDVMSAATIVSSELGNLLDTKDEQMTNMLIELWDCRRDTLKKVTKTMGSDAVENPWINMLGCTTPAWISGSFPDYIISGGLTSRCIFVYGEKKRRLVAYPGLSMNQQIKDMRPRLIEDLVKIAQLEGEFTLTPDAITWGEAWYAEHNENLAIRNPDYRMSGYYARKQTHLHKLAMVLSAAQRDDLVITEHTLEQANSILTAAETDMPKVFSHIGLNPETRAIESLIKMVVRDKQIDYSVAYREFSRYLTATKFDEVVKSAVQTGTIRKGTIGNKQVLTLGV